MQHRRRPAATPTGATRIATWAALALALATLTACTTGPPPSTSTSTSTQNGTLTIFATTGYLADAAAHIAPDAEIVTMVGPGGDPHTYQPSTRDIQQIHEADLVLANGLHLEAQMTDQIESLGDRQLSVGDALPADLLLNWPETDSAGNPLHDPHIWNSPEAWSFAVTLIADQLGDIDPAHAATYTANAGAYIDEFAAVAAETEALLAEIPEESRLLITGHDAFNYFGDAFGFEVRATDFISTDAALSARELGDLARTIADRRVPVIFQDNQANPQAITSLTEAVHALGWHVTVSHAELYADSLGAEPGVDTHLGVLRHNAHAVANALGGGAS